MGRNALVGRLFQAIDGTGVVIDCCCVAGIGVVLQVSTMDLVVVVLSRLCLGEQGDVSALGDVAVWHGCC